MASPEIPSDHEEFEEPIIDVELSGDTIEARRDNSYVVQYVVALAMYDHILIVNQVDEETIQSYWIFSQMFPDFYTSLSETMIEHDYPQHYFTPLVSDMVKKAYDLQLGVATSDLDGGIPAEWLK